MIDKHSRSVELYYPRLANDPKFANDSEIVDTIYVGLSCVRAARDIRIQYDFDRDGYMITAQNWDAEFDGPWYEVAFVPADERE